MLGSSTEIAVIFLIVCILLIALLIGFITSMIYSENNDEQIQVEY